ncbi:hypothetical protein, partial [Staphylococcus aureus]|uniref:hypothetical protein n=1 Tax=Staphylococcus aureus TaxID=1280 RepID=UPI001C4E3715
QSYKTKYRGKILYISSKKKQKSKTSFTGAFDFLVQKGLMGQPHLAKPDNSKLQQYFYVGS